MSDYFRIGTINAMDTACLPKVIVIKHSVNYINDENGQLLSFYDH